jgi:hypothetical protein
MFKKTAVILSTVGFAFLILAISVLNSCSIKVFSASPKPTPPAQDLVDEAQIDYVFVYTGSVLPDSPFWYFKALRDKVWLAVTTNPMKKAELSLLFADKRLTASHQLFKNNKPSVALSTLTKAEKYLDNARNLEATERAGGTDTKSFLLTLIKASIAHIGEIKKITEVAPEDIRPEVIKIENYAFDVYKSSKEALESQGIVTPKNPFNGD